MCICLKFLLVQLPVRPLWLARVINLALFLLHSILKAALANQNLPQTVFHFYDCCLHVVTIHYCQSFSGCRKDRWTLTDFLFWGKKKENSTSHCKVLGIKETKYLLNRHLILGERVERQGKRSIETDQCCCYKLTTSLSCLNKNATSFILTKFNLLRPRSRRRGNRRERLIRHCCTRWSVFS